MNQGSNRKTFYLAIIPLLLMLLPIVYSVATFAGGAIRGKPDPLLEISREISDSCVRNTEYMRLHHWELLLGVREQVIREGNREGPLLGDCRRCHSNRANFCDRCHKIANVMLDCFHCHYYPEVPDGASSVEHAQWIPPIAEPESAEPERLHGREVADG